MTPKARANLYFYGGIPLMILALATGAWAINGGGVVAVALAAVSVAAFIGCAIVSIATSRCPHCHRYINLAGPSEYCPKCGKWIPASEGDQPPRN